MQLFWNLGDHTRLSPGGDHHQHSDGELQGELREVLERACTPWPRVRAQGSSREGLYTTAPGQSPARGLRPLSCYDGQRTGPHSRLHLVLKGQGHSP